MKAGQGQVWRVVGLLLLCITLTGALWPRTAAPVATDAALAMRQLGHEYLSSVGDRTSRIPAIAKDAEGCYLLRLEMSIDYDCIAAVASDVFARYGLRHVYTLELTDCEVGTVFLGSRWQPGATTADEAACLGRDQEARCANVLVQFKQERHVASTSTAWWVLAGLTLVFIVVAPKFTRREWRDQRTGLQSERPPEPTSAALSVAPGVLLDEAGLRLSTPHGDRKMTYREAKLLAFFAAAPNEVLDRTRIHDAVWAEEGVITGRSLDVFVSRLRKKLAGIDTVEIQTVHGVGYRLRVG